MTTPISINLNLSDLVKTILDSLPKRKEEKGIKPDLSPLCQPEDERPEESEVIERTISYLEEDLRTTHSGATYWLNTTGASFTVVRAVSQHFAKEFVVETRTYSADSILCGWPNYTVDPGTYLKFRRKDV